MSENEFKLRRAFSVGLEIDEARVVDELAYNSIEEWDSVAHMQLVAEIEDTFDIMLETDDIIDMSSYAVARELLAKYDIAF